MIKKKKSELENFKSELLKKLKTESFNEILGLLKTPSQGVKNLISEESASITFAKSCSLDEINTNNDRLAVILIEKMYNLINQSVPKE